MKKSPRAAKNPPTTGEVLARLASRSALIVSMVGAPAAGLATERDSGCPIRSTRPGKAFAGELRGVLLHAIIERRRSEQIEEELNGGRDLVDVLTARAAGQHELFRQLPAGDRDAVVDL